MIDDLLVWDAARAGDRAGVDEVREAGIHKQAPLSGVLDHFELANGLLNQTCSTPGWPLERALFALAGTVTLLSVLYHRSAAGPSRLRALARPLVPRQSGQCAELGPGNLSDRR